MFFYTRIAVVAKRSSRILLQGRRNTFCGFMFEETRTNSNKIKLVNYFSQKSTLDEQNTSNVRFWGRGTGMLEMLQDGRISTENKKSLKKKIQFHQINSSPEISTSTQLCIFKHYTYLAQNIFKHKVVIIVRRRELDVL